MNPTSCSAPAEATVPDPGKQELTLKGFSGHLRFHPDDSVLVGMDDGTVVRLRRGAEERDGQVPFDAPGY